MKLVQDAAGIAHLRCLLVQWENFRHYIQCSYSYFPSYGDTCIFTFFKIWVNVLRLGPVWLILRPSTSFPKTCLMATVLLSSSPHNRAMETLFHAYMEHSIGVCSILISSAPEMAEFHSLFRIFVFASAHAQSAAPVCAAEIPGILEAMDGVQLLAS